MDQLDIQLLENKKLDPFPALSISLLIVGHDDIFYVTGGLVLWYSSKMLIRAFQIIKELINSFDI